MARSRKKPSARAASSAKAEAATESWSAWGRMPTTRRLRLRPRSRPPLRRRPCAKKPKGSSTGKDPVRPEGWRGHRRPRTRPGHLGDQGGRRGELPHHRSPRRRGHAEPPPGWPTAVVLLILGLLYLVTYYISAGQLPLPIGDWNLAVGFGVLMVGGGMLMFWKSNT